MGNWTNAGFESKTLDFYKSQLQQVFVKAYGDDFLLDDALPQGVVIQELAEILYAADMDGIEALSRLNLNTATGIYLDLIGNLRGIRRVLGTQANITVEITSIVSTLPYTIPTNAVFTSYETGEQFSPTEPVYVDSETKVISMAAASRGETSVALNSSMTSSIGNISNVVVTAVSQGAATEEDIHYRNRIINDYIVSNNTVQNIVNLLTAMDCVKTAGVEYNDTPVESGGIPAYCTEFMAVPVAGYDQSLFRERVAKLILDNKCPGSPTHGAEAVVVNDVFGKPKQVKFTIPTEKKIEIAVVISTPETTGIIDLSNSNSIREAISTYINSLGIGKDVSYARCLGPLAADTGFDIVSFKIRSKGEEEWVENANYIIGIREYATITTSDINIGV